ncbi:MAG: hypothetical protein R3251_02360 [Candidatus Spechtbacterales bacterium]|nr:hypothetical protein [Candidatus Spechtbacterales bacterium]
MRKKVTKKEYRQFIEPKLRREGFTRKQRRAIKSVFMSDLEDAARHERKTFFNAAKPGISPQELKNRMEKLRDEYSDLSKSMKYPLYKYPEKLDKLEEIMKEALEENKERWL